MYVQREHYRHVLLFDFLKGTNAVRVRNKLCEVRGEDCLTERQCQRWFARFRSGNFNLRDAAHTGRKITADDGKIKTLIETSRRMNSKNDGEAWHIEINRSPAITTV